MALNAATLSPLVLKDYFAAFPAATAVVRSNPTTGVPSHNPPTALVESICSGFSTALTSVLVKDSYAGVVGGSATATLVPPIFNPAVITSASTTLAGTLQWTGAYAFQLLDVLLLSFFSNVSSITQIQMPPIVGGGAGVGVVAPVSNPTLSTSMTTACQAAMVSSFTASGYFGIDDIPGGALTPQITAMITALSTAYGTIVGSVTAFIPYAGAASGSPFAFINSGKFI